MNPAQPPVHPGEILAGKYRVERILGTGGMGVVVAATHIELLEPRAIKFMHAAATADAEAVERFVREARASSLLKSEHVARVYDVGRLEDGAPYMVMEQLEGTDLSSLLKRTGPLPLEEAILYVLQASEALAEAHSRGIIHRDVKPANLFLTVRPDGTPCLKVLDFGISKMAGAAPTEPDITKTHMVLGSPHYMSPEQMHSSRDVDSRGDIWSLGVILYQLVTRRLPFGGQNITELVAAVLGGRLALPSEIMPGLPPAFDRVILRCLERDVSRRYANVGELAQDLLPFVPAAGALVDSILRITSGSHRSATGMPAVLVDSQRLKAIAPNPTSQANAWGRTESGPAFQPPPRSRALFFGAMAAAMAVGALIAWGLASSGGRDRAAESPVVASASVAAATRPPPPVTAAPTPSATETTEPAAPPPSASARATSSAAPAASPPKVPARDPFGMDRK